MNAAFIQARIDSCQAQIALYEAAVTAIITNGEASYSLNTGQSVIAVSKLNIKQVQDGLDSLLNRCSTLEARLNGASIHMVPAW